MADTYFGTLPHELLTIIFVKVEDIKSINSIAISDYQVLKFLQDSNIYRDLIINVYPTIFKFLKIAKDLGHVEYIITRHYKEFYIYFNNKDLYEREHNFDTIIRNLIPLYKIYTEFPDFFEYWKNIKVNYHGMVINNNYKVTWNALYYALDRQRDSTFLDIDS